MENMRNKYKTLISKSEGKRHLGKPRRRWDDNIRTDLTEIEWKFVYWTHVALDRDQWWDLVNMVMKLRVPLNAGDFSTI
jgi:hypothetical protein